MDDAGQIVSGGEPAENPQIEGQPAEDDENTETTGIEDSQPRENVEGQDQAAEVRLPDIVDVNLERQGGVQSSTQVTIVYD